MTDREMLEYTIRVLERADDTEALTDLLEEIRTHLHPKREHRKGD